MATRTRMLTYGPAVLLMIIGVALGAALGGLAGGLTALVLVSLGGSAVVLLMFYEIGLSDDRERAAIDAERERREHVEHRRAELRPQLSARLQRRWRPPRRPG